MSSTGKLVLVATPIGNLGDLAPRAVDALREADVIAAEDTRRTRALLTHAGVASGRRLRAVHGRNERRLAVDIVDDVRRGARVAYVTDAGMPGVSDPGERLVRACLDAGLPVEVVPGPSALLAALVVSGLPTQRFAFEAFLPRKGKARSERLAAIAREDRTVVLFEAPPRLRETLADLLDVCGPDRPVAIARELTKVYEQVVRGTVSEAIAHYRDHEPRGEHVVVVGPAPGVEDEIGDDALEGAIEAALADGLSARDAAFRVTEELGVRRRRAYDAATRLARAARS